MRDSIGFAAAAAMGLASVAYGIPTTTGVGGNGGNAQFPPPNALYSIDDGTAEDGVGFDGTPGNDLVWMNTFPKVAGAEMITTISIAFGTPTFPGAATDGTPVTVCLWSDADGGSPQNATLLATVGGVVSGANTNTFVTYDIPDTVVPSNTVVVGVLMRNAGGGTNPFPCALDTTPVAEAQRSFIGWGPTPTVDPSNMLALGTNWLAEEAIEPGNWLIRANGVAVPEPASLGLLGLAAVALGARRRRA